MAQVGNNIIVYAQNGSNWEPVAATKSDSLQVDGDTIEIAGSDENDQTWKRCIMGRKSWVLNVGWLVTTVADVRKVLTVGTRVKLRIGGRTFASNSGLEGYAWVKTCKVDANYGNLANGSFAFVGDGGLS